MLAPSTKRFHVTKACSAGLNVGQAHAAQGWSEAHTLAIVETATRKGHHYATVAIDLWLETGASSS